MKLGPFRIACSTALTVALTAGCGYRPAHAGRPPEARLTVTAARPLAPYPEALEAALAGARAELSRQGMLAKSAAYPRLLVELVRVDEVAAGMQATPVGERERPLARGSSVGVVVRAWVLGSAGGTRARDSGDVRRVEVVAQGADPLTSRHAFQSAVRAAARTAGEAAARRALGQVEPDVEPL